ncbi:MAG: alpha/beta fold hydrolase [Deltaproteobacteria bacterium]|nr:MAG: alpha/beta fold hydrolase [Deltaproteobacteria bacterium]
MACLITRNGALHYVVTPSRNAHDPDRIPLLLIPGLAATHGAFPEIVEDVSATRTVISFDPHGAGLSRPRRRLFALRDIAADAAALLDHLRIPHAHVLGISMGGMIAQELALGWPERVRSLHLACTTCGTPDGVAPPPPVVARLLAGLARTARVRSPRDADRLFRDVLFAPDTPEDIRLTFFANRQRAPMASPAGLTAQLLAVRRFGSGPRLRSLHIPTQVLTGRDDALMPARNSEVLAERIPRAELLLTRGGHAFFLEDRDTFTHALRSGMDLHDGR